LFFLEYIEDICPYATFQLNKQTYSESSYSGNVYSGPYHSVRGSFVYHDAKQDGYHVSKAPANPFCNAIVTLFFPFFQSQEPEYTKVRRKGGIGTRLRDPQTETQGRYFLYIHPQLIVFQFS
jgi:hypothetical protein